MRWFSKNVTEERAAYARETLDIYAPLANRLGVWQLKWELEDLSFRFLEPELYKRIAGMLDEKRLEREQYIAGAMKTLAQELGAVGVKAQITGRPKHIYSIWNKMRGKSLDFSEVYDVRALRVIVPEVKDCYAALGVVHNLWQPIPKEFDDYISRPKGNLYQSLHTAVIGPRGRTLEVQIRTEEMHRQAEYGVAAHWHYKEKAQSARRQFEQKVAWLRQLLAWRDEVADCKKTEASSTMSSTCSRRRAGCSTCRPARRRSTSPTRCTPTSATAAAAQGSTATSSSSTRRSPAASASRSSRRRPAGRRATG